MNTVTVEELRRLTDEALLEGVRSLAARERGATAELIAHLAELEARHLHLAAGYASMFAYCRDALMLSEHEAYNRIEAARAARRFPVILDLLMQGAVNLTTVRLLAPHLTPRNHVEVLASARGLSRPQVEQVVARLAPAPDVPTSVRKVPPAKSAAVVAPVMMTPPTAALVIAPVAETPRVSATPAAPAAAAFSALAPERYKLQLTISGDMLEKLRLAKDMLRHAVPSGNEEEILDRALTLLLAELAKKKFAASEKPRPAGDVTAGSRHVPAEIKRAVFLRDLGRCAFTSAAGRRCEERAFIEFHHAHAYADGGPATLGNIELRCRRHNAYEWQQRCLAVHAHEPEGLGRQRLRAGPCESAQAMTSNAPKAAAASM